MSEIKTTLELDLGTLTRRAFVQALAVGFFMGPSFARQALAQRMRQQIPYEMIDETGSFTTSQLNEFREKTGEALRGYIDSKISALGLPSRVVQVVQGYGYDFAYLTSQAEADRYIGFARDSIEDALKFWDSPFLEKPEIEFNVPTNENESKVEEQKPLTEDKLILINVLRNHGRQIQTKVYLYYRGSPEEVDVNLSDIRGDYEFGHSDRTYSYYLNDSEYALTVIRFPVNWFVEQGEQFSVHETPAHEVLHNQLGVWTDHHLFRDKEVQDLLGKKELVDKLKELKELYIRYEEILVNSLSTAWLIDYSKRKGLGLKPFYGVPETKGMLPKVHAITPQRLIQEYVSRDPIKFYEEIVKPPIDEVLELLGIEQKPTDNPQ